MDANDEQPLRIHQPCDDCGSSDALSVYTDHTFCFSCNTNRRLNPAEKSAGASKGTKVSKELLKVTIPDNGFASRKINEKTARRWQHGVATNKAGKGVQVYQYRDASNEIVAQKMRTADKKFPWAGSPKGVQLYGQWLWGGKGKRLVITEGENDAEAIDQVLGYKWPVVSLINGAGAAERDIRNNFDFVVGYKEVILCFDNDEAGRQAVEKAVALLSAHTTVKVAELPLKDANEMLMQGRAEELYKHLWYEAKEQFPDGVVNVYDLKDDWEDTPPVYAIPYPWDGLTKTTLGIRAGEIVTLCAGSGVGKTQVCAEAAYGFHLRGEKLGMIMREQSWSRTIDALVGLHMNKRIHIERAAQALPDEIRNLVQVEDFDQKAASAAFEELFGGENPKMVMDKHWGSEDFDRLLSKIRFMAVARGCRFVILDHLSIIVSGLEIDDERKAIDVAMTKLRTLCEATGVGIIIVSHLKRPDGNKGFEEGLEVTLSHLRGSQAISQLSDMVIALQRNKRHEVKRNYTEVVVLKNRFTGEDGCTACWLKFDNDTGRLIESPPPPDKDMSNVKVPSEKELEEEFEF